MMITRAICLTREGGGEGCAFSVQSPDKLDRGECWEAEWQVLLPTVRVRYYIGILLEALDAIGAEGQGRRFVMRGRGAGSRRRQVRHTAVVMRVLLRSGSIAEFNGQHDHEDHQEQPRCGSHHGAQQWTRQRQHNWREGCKLCPIVSGRIRRTGEDNNGEQSNFA